MHLGSSQAEAEAGERRYSINYIICGKCHGWLNTRARGVQRKEQATARCVCFSVTVCVSVCAWVCSLWMCKYMSVCYGHMSMWVGTSVWVVVSVSECICECASMREMLCYGGLWASAHTVCQWYVVGLAWGATGSLCKGWKWWDGACCAVTVPSTCRRTDDLYTFSEWTAASPPSAGNRIWSVSITCSLGFFSGGFILLDKEGKQEFFLLCISNWT